MSNIQKSVVTTGIFWVEIPKAKLRLLCGSPADTVKWLRKRGLIADIEVSGVKCQSGPNAVLLSDILIQNGQFSNLTEFPVLQMLYMQGLIIPNHPNNSGQKPLLIGSPEQLEAQKAYIYRGNYGLVSQEEIAQAGMSPTTAEKMMRVKERFAFGKLRQVDELLDTIPVKGTQQPAELPGGAWVKRLDINIFEIGYGEESVTVDLNLKPEDAYKPSYQLNFHTIKRDYFSVVHSGEGDGWDVHRPCMASILIFQGRIYLIDAGPNVIESLKYLGISTNEIAGLFHTHGHDDHFAGLATLIRTDRRLKYYASKLVRKAVSKKLCGLMGVPDERFEEFFEVHDLPLEKWSQVDGLHVFPFWSPHPVETNTYLFRAQSEHGFQTYAHLGDVTSHQVLQQMLTHEADQPGINADDLDKVLGLYSVEAQLKKVDVGGGMIHGEPEDFRHDPSHKLVFAHTHTPIGDQYKEIGSTASFGMVDVLIPGRHDYLFQLAQQYLQFYFPNVPESERAFLLNHPIAHYNAGTVLCKKDTEPEKVFLILTGLAECLHPATNHKQPLPAGSLVSFLASFTSAPSHTTYWAESNIHVLEISAIAYQDFVQRNHLYQSLKELESRIILLEQSPLFGEAVSFPILAEVAKQMQPRHYQNRQPIPLNDRAHILLIEQGEVQADIRGFRHQLSKWAFFGGEREVSQSAYLGEYVALDQTLCHAISPDTLREIPVAYWTYIETIRKRRKASQEGLL